MTAIRRKFVIFRRPPDVLCNAVLEAEAKVICAIRIPSFRSPFIKVGSEGEISKNADAALEANAETVHGGRISQFSRPPIILRRTEFVPRDPFPKLETARKIVEPLGMRKRCGASEITNGQIHVCADADSALEATAEAV
jgi:hypothetical protein